MKRLGIVGGLGPMASVYFYQQITELTRADKDQEHLEIALLSLPGIPDRTDYILGRSDESPVPAIISATESLLSVGAEIVAIPCVTAHCFMTDIEKNSLVPVLNMIEETARCLRRHQIARACIMATDGTVSCSIFQSALERQGIEVIMPDTSEQSLIMSFIYNDIKAGRQVDPAKFSKLISSFVDRGAQAVVLGCTELSLINRNGFEQVAFFDALEILAAASVQLCGARLTEKGKRILGI